MTPVGSKIRNAAANWAKTQNLDLQKLDAPQKQAVIADVAAQTSVPKAQVMNELVSMWSQANEERGQGLEKSGAGWAYQGIGAARSVKNSALGVVMNARAGGALPKAGAKRLTDDAINKLGDTTATTAQQALGIADFSERNVVHADVVAKESSTLAAASSGKSDTLLDSVFQKASRAAGELFASAFNDDGTKIEANEADYKTAMKGAGPIAYEAMKTLSMDASGIVDRTEIEDLGKMVAGDLGVDLALDNKTLKSNLKSMRATLLEGDWFLNPDENGQTALDRIPDARDGKALNASEVGDLNVGIRLANATWRSGQVHRAAWEGKDNRINPEKKTAYNPFDKLKREMFDQSVATLTQSGVAPEKAQELAFSRVVFEVWKDLDQLKGARAAETGA